MTGNRNHKRGRSLPASSRYRSFSLELQTMTGNRNHKRGKVIAIIIKVQEFLYPCGRVADHEWEQEPQGGKVIASIIKVQEFLFRVADHDWEQEPQEGEGRRQHHQGTGVSL
jgi:hypothetical protein